MKIIFSLFILLFPLVVSANRGGNGGGGWVCRENNNNIRWVEILDLYEAQHLFGLTLRTFKAPIRDILEQMMDRLPPVMAPAMYARSIDELNLLKENPPKISYTDSPIPVSEDAFYFTMPKKETCLGGTIAYEQIVNYRDYRDYRDSLDNPNPFDKRDYGTILVQRQLFNSLSETAKAALIFHEGVYATSRIFDQNIDSFEARRIVGLVFSSLSYEKVRSYLSGYQDSDLKYGDYILNMQQIDSHGFLAPFQNQKLGLEISIDTEVDPIFLTVVKTDEHGLAQIKVNDPKGGKKLTSSRVVTWLEDLKYGGTVPKLGHAQKLSVDGSSSEASFLCETFFQRLPNDSGPGIIDVTCARNSSSSQIFSKPPKEEALLKCTLSDGSGMLTISVNTEGTLAANWCSLVGNFCADSYQYEYVSFENLARWRVRFDDNLSETCKVLNVDPSKVAAAIEYKLFNPGVAGSDLYVLLDDNMTNLGAVYFQYRPKTGYYPTACKK